MDQTLDRDLIRSVSRSFSLTLLALPSSRREFVALTYLLARLADTITDSGRWTSDLRMKHLTSWETAIGQKNKSLWRLEASLGSFSDSEAQLLLKGADLIETLSRLSPQDLANAQQVLQILISGMKWDLKTFGSAGNSTEIIYGCPDSKLFEWYTFAIAGCVGSFWVKAFSLPPTLENLAIEYGKGLQRINILRDVVEDWRRGRVYLPKASLEHFKVEGIEPWLSKNWTAFVRNYCLETRKFLIYGANFCDAIPYSEFRLRWASRMPLVIGLKTLDRLERQLQWSETPVKISRRTVKKLGFKSLVEVLLSRKLSGRVAV